MARVETTIKGPATNDISRGWCRMMGLAPLLFLLGPLPVVRNLRVLDACEARQAEDLGVGRGGFEPP
ncbi:MAG: hypothetical protein ACRDZX_08715 [Acidimicrobiales bacterium]